ncbi:hypothetical protein KAR91_12210 [Candidatus Pacearchaeota archaeon]|nr:hypothetical protein [Candidatus Pacearchaeota archaeon]
MKKLLALVFTLVLLTSCATANLPSVCDNIEEGQSYLCQVAEKRDVRLEDIGNVLIVANAVSIGEGWYSGQNAIDVMREIRSALDSPVSYLYFKAKVEVTTKKYPGLLEVAEIYLGEFTSSKIMYTRDRQILIDWFDNRIERLEAIYGN